MTTLSIDNSTSILSNQGWKYLPSTESGNRVWTICKDACLSTPLITFVFFRALQLVIPAIGFGLELAYLYLKSIYNSYQISLIGKENSLLSTTLKEKIEKLQAVDVLTTQIKESFTKSEEARKAFEIENSLLSQKHAELEQEYNKAAEALEELTNKQKVLEADYAALKEMSYTHSSGQNLEKGLEKLPDAQDVIPQTIRRFEQDKEILRMQLENLPDKLSIERNTLARSCKTLDELIYDLKAKPIKKTFF